jgi:hypothetical protein
VFRQLLEASPDAEAMQGFEAQRFQDQHVERALDDVGARFRHVRSGGCCQR